MSERDITQKMLRKIREGIEKNKKVLPPLNEEEKNDAPKNFLRKAEMLMEEVEKKNEEGGHDRKFVIHKNTPQFGDIRTSQEETLKKTISEQITLGDDALTYYPDSNDMVLDGKITSLNMSFQFRFNDPSGDGCYIWTDALQLTETNSRTIGKVRDAFLNWKSSLIENGDLMDKLKRAANRD